MREMSSTFGGREKRARDRRCVHSLRCSVARCVGAREYRGGGGSATREYQPPLFPARRNIGTENETARARASWLTRVVAAGVARYLGGANAVQIHPNLRRYVVRSATPRDAARKIMAEIELSAILSHL